MLWIIVKTQYTNILKWYNTNNFPGSQLFKKFLLLNFKKLYFFY